MKRKSFLAMAAGLSLSLFVSCVHKDQLPENPKDKQEHKDSHGNSWIYDAMLMRWLFMPRAAVSLIIIIRGRETGQTLRVSG